MTVCVAIKVDDGIVFAADSATSLTSVGPSGGIPELVWTVWNHGVKVFNLHRQLPLVAMTAGMGHIGQASISTLTKDLRILLTNGDEALKDCSYTLSQVTDITHTFFKEKYEKQDKPPNPHLFTFWIGGYGSGDDAHGEIWRLDGTSRGRAGRDSP